jgi:GH25 family lysozyme M1 (1,4-beta-N-acetylmuramidase)
MRSLRIWVAALGMLAAIVVAAPAASAADCCVQGVDAPAGGTVDWSRVASAGYGFVAIKATEGTGGVNSNFAAEAAGAKAAGLYVAGYHFAVPDLGGGKAQADYTVDNSGYTADGRTLPILLDIEYNPYGGGECYGLSAAAMVDWISTFATEVRARTGKAPIVYTTTGWWNTCTGGSTAFGADPLWIGALGATSPTLPAGWSSWTFWQYADATVAGIPGTTGISYFNGDADGLAALAG